jgi:hypothetical protein
VVLIIILFQMEAYGLMEFHLEIAKLMDQFGLLQEFSMMMELKVIGVVLNYRPIVKI